MNKSLLTRIELVKRTVEISSTVSGILDSKRNQ
jgi:hypothetical protein